MRSPLCLAPLSPRSLVALMYDQVMALRQCGVPASFTSASQEDDKYPGQSVWAAVTPRRTGAKEKNGWGVELRLLYVTPEKLKASDAVWAKLKALEAHGLLDRFVVDEAHCVGARL